ncbi:MAG: GIY-YIG nuclease family protein [Candidatus Thiodiazotropha sp.]
MSCEVKNLIYVIRCGGCHEEYIGETGDTLRHRVTVHKQQIRDASTRMLYVSGHIDHCARNKPIKFKIWPLYKMQSDNAALRKMKEQFFINLFKPKLNRHI